LIAYIPGFGHKLQKNSEVMIVVDEFQISWCSLSCMRAKKD